MSISLSPPKSDEEVLAEYREAIHRGEDVSVEEVAEKIPVYVIGKARPVGSVTVALPVAPQVTQQVVSPNQFANQQAFPPMLSGVFVSGMMPVNRLPWSEAAEDQEQRKERMNNMGNKVLRHVNAHETSRLGELSDGIRDKMDYLKKNASFTNDQWKAFAELKQQLDEMIGDPYDPESTESD